MSTYKRRSAFRIYFLHLSAIFDQQFYNGQVTKHARKMQWGLLFVIMGIQFCPLLH